MNKKALLSIRSPATLLVILLFMITFTFTVFGGLAFISPTPTLDHITNQTVSFLYINITSNSTIATNGSTIYRWFNNTEANVNFTANTSSVIVSNATGPDGGAAVANYTSRNFTNLGNGRHRFVVYVYSNDTESTEVISINITIDTAAPTATADLPGNATNTSDTTPEITINLTDNVHLQRLNATLFVDNAINGASKFFDNNTNVRFNTTPLENGTHRARIQVIDPTGNSVNSTLITFVVDDTLPVATSDLPANNTYTSDTTPEISVNVTDNVHLVDINATLFVDGVASGSKSVSNNANVRFNVSNQANGTHRAQIQFRDPSGNTVNSTLITFTVDDTAPIITWDRPVNMTNTSDTTPEISFNVTDGVVTTLSYKVFVAGSVDGTGSVSNNSRAFYNLTAQKNGTFRVSVEINDSAFNTRNSTLITLIIDDTPPIATFTSPANDSATKDSTPNVIFNMSDTAISNLSFKVYVDGTFVHNATALNGTSYTYTLPLQVNGTHRVYVDAFDGVGNHRNSTLLTFLVDNSAIGSTLSYPTNASNLSDTTPEIQFTLVDNFHASGLVYRVYVDGTADVSGTANNNTLTFVNLSALSEGTHRISVDTNDTADNSGNSTLITITVDESAPTVASFTLLNRTINENLVGVINFTVTDTGSFIDSCKITVYDGNSNPFTNISGSMNGTGGKRSCYVLFNNTNLPLGAFRIEPRGTDMSGNNASGGNLTNWTNTPLYAGWNLVSMNKNSTLNSVANWSYAITKVSYYNNTGRNYTTYTVGSETFRWENYTTGDALYVFVNTSYTLISNVKYWHASNAIIRNITVRDGWNQASFFNNTGMTLNQTCSESLGWGNSTIRYVSYYNTSSSQYTTHRCTFRTNNATTIPKGYSYWLNVNFTSPYVRTGYGG